MAVSLLGCGAGPKGLRARTAVGRGVTHSHIVTEDPFDIHVVDVDLTEPTARLEVFRTRSLVRTSELAKRAEEGGKVVAAVNGDFFSFKTGWPVGNQVTAGKMVLGVQSVRSHLFVTSENKPGIEALSFAGGLRISGGSAFPVGGVNQKFNGDTISLYTSSWYDSSGVDSGRAYIVLRLAGESWNVGDTISMIVLGRKYARDQQIRDDEGVLSLGKGTIGNSLIAKLKESDTVRVFLGFSGRLQNALNVIGGGGRILNNGRKMFLEDARAERIGKDFLERRHPRTFVGFDRDTTHLFICTVDGRQKSSLGMNFEEMADFLLSLGAWNAMNLDGGGSTTMIVNDTIVNSTSDKAGERPVANILLVRRVSN